MQIAIENAINYDLCKAETGAAKLTCEIDKATANIGALFSRQVEGRVSTEVCMHAIQSFLLLSIKLHYKNFILPWKSMLTQVDPRLAYDTGTPANICSLMRTLSYVLFCRHAMCHHFEACAVNANLAPG